MKISLIGYMGSGKSTVGKELSQLLDYKFIDLDAYLVSKYGKSIQELFKTEGEIKFRKYEHESLKEIIEFEESFILALGGGTPAYYNNMDLINQNTESIYLRLTPKELIERLKNEKSTRPLLAHLNEAEMPEFIAKHLFERRNFYEQAKSVIDVKEKEAEEIAKEIISMLPLLK